MDVCERTAHHDPAGPEWRDKFFVDCANALMSPANCHAVGTQPWLPALLRCCVVRLNQDSDPLLPAREAIAALKVLTSVARCPDARPAVRDAVMALGDRVDELFHDRLQGIRSVSSVGAVADDDDGAAAAPNAKATSVVHNTLVVCLMRIEGYALSASALLDLVDGDVGALMSIVLAISKIATYELGVTANCLGVVESLTHPKTYFAATGDGAGVNEHAFSTFASRIRTLHTVWAAANAYDTIVPAVHRRAARFAKELPPSALNKGATTSAAPSSPVTPTATPNVSEAAAELTAFARCMTSLCRAVANLVNFSPDAADAAQLRQHVLVVQDTCTVFASLMMNLGGAFAIAAAETGSERARTVLSALAAGLELQALASRDVLRVPRPLQTAMVVAIRAVLDATNDSASSSSSVLSSRFITAAVVAMTNAGLLARAPEQVAITGVTGPSDDGAFETEIRAAAVDITARLASVISAAAASAASSEWIAALTAHPNAHHQRASDMVAVLADAQAEAIDDEMATADAATARLEEDLAEMKTARGQVGTAAAAAANGADAPAKAKQPAPDAPAPLSSVARGSLLGDLPSIGRGTVASPSKALAFADVNDSPAVASPATRAPAAAPAPMEAPAEFLCALRGTLMAEPVKLPCGRYVDRRTLADVVRDVGHVDPVTAKPLPNDFDPTAIDAEHKKRLAQFRFELA
eukprot:CAMPEP_0174860052 /NCGR_PEP_ID=MMETSP1114-20130205/48094_1 /TAXON_ID=312471 /ORGANISM="Neobodo designis, Strain CCAP 1951/1" /LENGTH=696 /DNA_ID=CAMNT_0016095023 /DNA_START=75 /DNA_END=2161 /DNA_ORIENTATION=+